MWWVSVGERISQHLIYYLGQYHINIILIYYGNSTWYVEPNGFENKSSYCTRTLHVLKNPHYVLCPSGIKTRQDIALCKSK